MFTELLVQVVFFFNRFNNRDRPAPQTFKISFHAFIEHFYIIQGP